MQLRVVIVSDHAFVSGGSAQVALTSAKALAREGATVTVFAACGPPDPSLAACGIRVECLSELPYNRGSSMRRAVWAGLWDRGAAGRLRVLLEEMPRESTVVHIHSFVDALSASVPAAAMASGHPVAITLHDYNFGCPYGGFFDYRRNDICRLTGLSGACWRTNCSTGSYPRKLWRNSRLWLQRAKCDFSQATFVFISEFSKARLEPYLPSQARKTLIRNPIDVPKQEPAHPEEGTAFAFLGRLTKEKGPLTFAEAAKLAGIQAVFLGAGPLEAAVRAANPSAELTGWIDREAALDRIRGSRALVFPSLWLETAGMSVQEAVALGVPCVVSDACAAAEFIRDGETGLLFRRGDPADLADKLKALLEDGLAARLGRMAYEAYWSDPPTVERHTSSLLGLYRNLLGGLA